MAAHAGAEKRIAAVVADAEAARGPGAGDLVIDLSNFGLHGLPPALVALGDRVGALHLGNGYGNIMGNRFDAPPRELTRLTGLRVVNLRRVGLASLPEDFSRLAQLQYLDLAANQLASLPEDFSRLAQLQSLDLKGNQLASLPGDFSRLAQLQSLVLWGNRLASLPEDFSRLAQLQFLDLGGNPLDRALLAAADSGIEALFRYLDAEKTALPEGKLLLIGPPEVGKSSLLAALRGEPNYQGDRPQTHPLERKDLRLGKARFNAWDFGGQTHYRATQQLFYSHGVYLALWDPRHRERTWRELVQQLELVTTQVAPSDAKVFIVASHQDDCEAATLDPAEIERLRSLLREALPDEAAVAFHHLNTIGDREGVEALKRCVIREAVESGFVTLTMEKRWAPLFTEATGGADDPGWPELYLDWEDYAARVRRHPGLTDDDARQFASRMYHMGRWAYYREEGTLANLVVLRPEWVTRAAAEILNAEVTKHEYGVIRYEDFCRIVARDSMDGKAPYPPETHEPLLQLLIQAGFCWVDHDPWTPPNPGMRITFPERLNEDPPDNLPTGWTHGNVWTVGYQFIDGGGNPIDLVEEIGLNWRFTSRLRDTDIEDELPTPNRERFKAWRHGVYRDLGEGREVKATFDPEVRGGPRTRLTLSYRGGFPTQWEILVRHLLIELKNKLAQKARIRRFISCAPACKGGEACFGREFFKFNTVEVNARTGTPLHCDLCDKEIESGPLLLASPPNLDERLEDIAFQLRDARSSLTGEIRESGQSLTLQVQRTERHLLEKLSAIDGKIDDLSGQAKAIYDELQKELPALGEQVEAIARYLNDGERNGPRLVRVREMPWAFPGNLKIATVLYEAVLVCEHYRLPVPVLETMLHPSKRGKDLPGRYSVRRTRKWLKTFGPYLGLVTRLAHTAMTGVANVYPDLHKGAVQDTELGMILAAGGGGGSGSVTEAPFTVKNLREATGPKLQQLHAFLQDSGAAADGYGGLHKVRIAKKGELRGRIRWVHWSAVKYVDPVTEKRWYELF
ncbi:MAG: hypothetical protein H7A52_16510 [Akkermansiaceae bacterium]|nr:hypothetical protein [Akkermansiaceae bacterium]